MALQLPSTLSPSKVSTYTNCALQFRFSAIDRIPEPPTEAASRGTLVHSALERLFMLPNEERTPEAAEACLLASEQAFWEEADYLGLKLNEKQEAKFAADARKLLVKYFKLEDPRQINPVGLELRVEAMIGDLKVRGVIDRLELDEDGGLVVTDYKTGRTPPPQFEQSRLGGVHFYAFMCEQVFGRRPSRVQLLHLGDATAIINEPSEQSIRGMRNKVGAIWNAIERACEREDFRPKKGKLCDWCSYKEYCPAFGGSIEEGVAVAVAAREEQDRQAARRG